MQQQETIIKVKNLNGTSDSQPEGYSEWKAFWEGKTNKKFGKCSNQECQDRAEVGAHVKIVSSHKSFENNKWYIVPLCKKCNNTHHTEEFYVNIYDLCLENQ